MDLEIPAPQPLQQPTQPPQRPQPSGCLPASLPGAFHVPGMDLVVPRESLAFEVSFPATVVVSGRRSRRNPVSPNGDLTGELVIGRPVPQRGLDSVGKPNVFVCIKKHWERHMTTNAVILGIFILILVGFLTGFIACGQNVRCSNGASHPQEQKTPETTQSLEGLLVTLMGAKALPLLGNASTPQGRALYWLQHEDEMHLNSWSDAKRLGQRFALASLFFATGGQGWKSQLNFLSGKHECLWHLPVTREEFKNHYGLNYKGEHLYKGAYCWNDNKTVTNLTLYFNNLTGTIPDEISLLSGLEFISLEMQQNHRFLGDSPYYLGGQLPSSLGKLAKLRHISLVDNYLTGSIPPIMGNLSQLSEIYLDANDLTGSIPSTMGLLSHLNSLCVSNNFLTGNIPTEINQLQQVQFISFANNILTGTLPFAANSFPRLIGLVMRVNDLSGTLPDGIITYSSLKWFYMGANRFSGALSPKVGNLTNLLHIELADNLISGTLPTQIGLLHNLEMFSIQKNQLTGTVPSELSNLKTLSTILLQNNSIQGDLNFMCDNRLPDDGLILVSDCHGDTPEVQCGDCCSSCCDDGLDICDWDETN